MDADKVFWDRVEEMPAWEAEQECVSRRERLCLENAMLGEERNKLMPLNSSIRTKEHKALGIAIQGNESQCTKLNERIRYLRKLQDRVQWKDAVINLFGQESFEQCVVWLEQQYGHMAATRREWAGK
jgi:hypothetical protein